MKSFGKLIVLGGIVSSLIRCSSGSQESEKQKYHNQEKIAQLLSSNDKDHSGETEILTSQEQDKIPIVQLSISELEGGPLRGNKRMIAGNYGDLLGFSQAESIMRNFNQFPDSVNFSAKTRLKNEDKIRFPLIYPELKHYFPDSLKNLWQNNEAFLPYKRENIDHLLIVSKCENGKNALAYYEQGRLKMATYVSIGNPRTKTIRGSFPVKHDAIFRRSRKYQNAAMPYSLHIKGHYFLHQGWSDGSPRSHGCIRVPGLYQKWLFEHLPILNSETIEKDKIPTIILEGLYTPTLLPLE